MLKTMHTRDAFDSFIIQLKRRNKITLLPWEQDRWFRGSYSTIQRTLRNGFSPLSDDQKTKCAELLFSELQKLKSDGFDKGIESLILRISSDFSLSVGHAQKLVSITTKYAAACNARSDGGMPDALKSMVKSNYDLLPVPIDAIVLYQLRQRYPSEFSDVQAGTGKDKRGRPIFWAKVCVGDKFEAWSRISDYKTYWSLQLRIRSLAAKTHESPLEFEMKNLWVAA